MSFLSPPPLLQVPPGPYINKPVLTIPLTIHLLPSNLSRPLRFHTSGSNQRLCLCHAALSPPPPPPDDDPTRLKGVGAMLSRIQDRVRIFFAVLLWMSLFFWGSAWDGRNNAHDRRDKGSRPRR